MTHLTLVFASITSVAQHAFAASPGSTTDTDTGEHQGVTAPYR